MNTVIGSRISGMLTLAALAVAGLSGSRAEAFTAESSGAALTFSDEYIATSASAYSSNTAGTDYSLDVPGQYSFQRAFGSTQSYTLGTSTVGNYAFQDSYVFQVGSNASVDVLTAQLSLPGTFSVSNLQFRLYQITSGTTAPVIGGSLKDSNGNLIPPVVAVKSAWQGNTGVSTALVAAYFTGLQTDGTYVLDVAGTASGSSGGLYVGSLNLQPVPLPATAWFMLSGLGGLGFMARRRNAA